MIQELHNLQENFQNYLFNGNCSKIINDIVSNEMISSVERMKIYHEAYYLRLLNALKQDYPAVFVYLGEALFNHLGEQYIREYPSTSPSLRWFGQEFPKFIQSKQKDYADFLYDLARFELALVHSFDAEDASLLTITELQMIAPEKWVDIQFHFHASVQIISLNWNVISLWKKVHSSKFKNYKSKKYQRSKKCLIWRHELETYFTVLKTDEAFALQSAKEGTNFGEICAGLSRWVSRDKLVFHAAEILNSWIRRGLIIKVYQEKI